MNYVKRIDSDVELLFHYDLRYGESYSSDVIYSNPESAGLYELINKVGFEVGDAESHSGVFKGDYSNITGHFVENFSNQGALFDEKSYIEISNADDLDSDAYTFIISQEKRAQGPEILFSNYSDDPSDPKGFELGINSANKLYFEYTNQDGPRVYTLNNIPHAKNIYVVKINKSTKSLSLSWRNVADGEFETKNFIINPNFIRKSDNWYIGSGIYSGDEGINKKGTPYVYDGFIDRFLCFEGEMGDLQTNLICDGLYGELDYTPPISGWYEGHVTGYSTEIDEIVSGITGFQEVITGYKTYTRETEKISGYELWGYGQVGGVFYEPLDEMFFQTPYGVYDDENLYYRNPTGIYKVVPVEEECIIGSEIGEACEWGITGFWTGSFIDTYSWEEPLTYLSGVSGVLYNTYSSPVVSGDSLYYRESDGYYSFSTSNPQESGYGPKSYTYLGARNPTSDLIETQKGINFLSINQYADVFTVEKLDGRHSIVFSSDFQVNPDAVNLSINGVSQPKGTLVLDDAENYSKIYNVNSGNFAFYEPSSEEYQYGASHIYYKDDDLSLIVDTPVVELVESGTEGYLEILETSEYFSAPFSEIDPTSNKIFFNGQKIYLGVDYENDGGKFNPIGDILNMSGVFHTETDWLYDQNSPSSANVTGVYDIHETVPFVLDSYLSYLNGIKLDPKAFVQHDKDVDLINQGKAFIMEGQMYEVLNNKFIKFYEREISDSITATGSDWAVYNTTNEYGNVVGEDWLRRNHGAIADLLDPPQIIDLKYEDL